MPTADSPQFQHVPQGGGEMGTRIRSYDWANTSLGAPEDWQQSLRSYLSLMLQSGFPMLLFWGPEQTCFYNDAFRPSLGNEGKHPGILGKPAQEAWEDVWHFLEPQIARILAGGEAVWFEDQLVPIYRNGKKEDVYWTFSYSPVSDDAGAVAGMLVTCVETTKSVERLKLLKESEQRFQNLLRNATVGLIVMMGEEMRVEMVNEAYCRLIEHTTAEVLRRPIFEILPDAETYFRPIMEEVLRTGKERILNSQPYSIRGADGNLIEGFLNLVYQPYREADGAISGMMVVVHDVTEQTLAQRRAEESEAFGVLLSNSVPAMIFYLDVEQRYRSYNETFMQWFRVDKREVIGKTIQEFIGDAAYARALPHLLKAYGGERDQYEMPAPTRLAPDRWLCIVYTPHKTTDGEIAGIIVHATDITQSKQTEIALRESEERLQAAIELAQLATWNIDLQQRQITYSLRLREWLGITERTLSFDDSPLIYERDRERVGAALQAALTPGGSGIFEETYTVIHISTGQHRIIHSSGKTEFNADGNPVCIRGISQDVTVQHEAQLTLEAEVQQRTEQLAAAIEELKMANEQLQHSNEELAQYAYVASHDLQEPLRKIRVFSAMLKGEGHLAGSKEQIVDKINRSAARMSGLIKDLLDFSRLLKSDSLMQPVSLRDAVLTVWSDFELLAEEKAASLELGELPTIQGIGLQINQLFYNLIANALKFTVLNRAPKIVIAAASISGAELAQQIGQPSSSSSYVHITVRDNGIGFEAQYNEQIFEVFKRLHAREQYPGSGIGLALCRRIAANHNGFLYAESDTGKGSTFHIILPERQQQMDSPEFQRRLKESIPS